MKRKIFLSIIIFIILISGLFLLTGCKKNDSNVKETPVEDLHKSELVDMRYNEPSNYLKKEPMGLADYKVISYTFTEEGKSINLYYNKGKDYSFAPQDEAYEEKTINGITWRVYHNNDMGVYDTCYHEHNGALYYVELNAVDKYQSEFDTFMNGVSFQ